LFSYFVENKKNYFLAKKNSYKIYISSKKGKDISFPKSGLFYSHYQNSLRNDKNIEKIPKNCLKMLKTRLSCGHTILQ